MSSYKHLSIRLAWHDRAWDGRVCDLPHLNTSCIALKTIREARDDEGEKSCAGKALNEIDIAPPCNRDIGAYSPISYLVNHRDPLYRSWLDNIDEEIPPYSSCTAPYRRMREENFRDVYESEGLNIRHPENKDARGWVREADRQIELLNSYWNEFEEGKSLIFYYVDENPLDESASKILIGIGRLKKIGDQIYYPNSRKEDINYPLWSRLITQDYPVQGVRIPYQEYIRKNKPTDHIVCKIPQNHSSNFSFVTEYVPDDVALVAVENMIKSIEQVKKDRIIKDNWDDKLAWLDGVLGELWNNRGAYPGIGAMLQSLGFDKGHAYHRFILSPLAKGKVDIWEKLENILEGQEEPEDNAYKNGILRVREKWQKMQSLHKLLGTLVKFELTKEQMERIIKSDTREKTGITASIEEITENPYILCESDLGTAKSSPIGLDAIDHGMLPDGDAALFIEKIDKEDCRRIRATAKAVLDESAQMGDTVIHLNELIEKMSEKFSEHRKCHPEKELICSYEDFLNEILWTSFDSDIQTIALKSIRILEEHTANMVRRRAKKIHDNTPKIDWKIELEKAFGKPENERQEIAITEKEKALDTLLKQKISVLIGSAGTGKTSVLQVFLDGLKKIEGQQSILLLAPTGKARVRLSTKTKRNAFTIHQLLLKAGWLYPQTFQLKNESQVSQSEKEIYDTIIIDECSMISTDLLGTLLKAVDLNHASRIIFVGDPSQLAPIGPGRPFFDIIEWLKKETPGCLANLITSMRTTENGEESDGLLLAEKYRFSSPHPADDEILSDIAKGKKFNDLEVVFWGGAEGEYNLLDKLTENLIKNCNLVKGDYQSFNQSLGIDKKTGEDSEQWQILSPTRMHHYGTEDINRHIQKEYKAGLMQWSFKSKNYWVKPFGNYQIVRTDKVMQNKNQSRNAWSVDKSRPLLNYMANGEIGIVTYAKNEYLNVSFSTQTEASYKFSRSQVEDTLELAYALTVHKSQGSDFETVFLVIPKDSQVLSREFMYTALTRFRKKLVLLIEEDIHSLLKLKNEESSDITMRNTNMFELLIRERDTERPYIKNLIHRTRSGELVRSKSEVIVADILYALGVSYKYEEVLPSKDNPKKDFRLPDFTVAFEGDVWYWEHLGLLNSPKYKAAWKRKLEWYKANGYFDRLITSEDAPDGSIDAEKIEKIAREKILGE